MTVICEYDVQVKILDDDGVTPLLDFHDHANGLCVERITPFEETVREDRRASSLYVDGDSLRAWAYDSGPLQAIIHCDGADWGAQEAAWQAARAVYRARDSYKLLVVLRGASYLYRVDRPYQVIPGDIGNNELSHCVQTYFVRWRAQPDFTVAVTP